MHPRSSDEKVCSNENPRRIDSKILSSMPSLSNDDEEEEEYNYEAEEQEKIK